MRFQGSSGVERLTGVGPSEKAWKLKKEKQERERIFGGDFTERELEMKHSYRGGGVKETFFFLLCFYRGCYSN